jgi:hypothetical protein
MEATMKVVALIGEPCSGKSTLTRRLISKISKGDPFKVGLIFGTLHFKEKIVVLGSYPEGQRFPGTDQFSMAVQPKAQDLIISWGFQRPDWALFFEGDRLGNRKFLEFCINATETEIFLLEASEAVKTRRHAYRKDSQSEKFLKSRSTKINNIRTSVKKIKLLKNETKKDFDNATSEILKSLLSR